jgi:hypothetical protein
MKKRDKEKNQIQNLKDLKKIDDIILFYII